MVWVLHQSSLHQSGCSNDEDAIHAPPLQLHKSSFFVLYNTFVPFTSFSLKPGKKNQNETTAGETVPGVSLVTSWPSLWQTPANICPGQTRPSAPWCGPHFHPKDSNTCCEAHRIKLELLQVLCGSESSFERGWSLHGVTLNTVMHVTLCHSHTNI